MAIQLTEDEAAAAYAVAQRRNSLNGGGSNIPGGETADVQERLRQHFAACLAELAVSRYFNLCWSGCGKGSEGLADVGDRLEVRSITQRGRGLLIRPKDREAIFILGFVTVKNRSVELLGWKTASEVRKYGREFEDCHILPEEKLYPMDLLPWRRAQ